MDLEQLNDTVDYLEARICDLEAKNAELQSIIWNHPKFRELQEQMEQFSINEFARYAESICFGLNKAFKEHFENDEYEVPEEEFNRLIAESLR